MNTAPLRWILILVFATAFTGVSATVAAEPQRMPLWPDAAEGANGAPGASGNAPGDRPELVFYAAEGEGPAPCIVVIPGGGYGGLASDHEGTQIAQWCNSMGVAAAICMYRHRNSGAGYGYPYPIMDAQRAIQMVRAHADSWGIDPARVGIIGFSAGGHLASSVCTTDALATGRDQDPIAQQSARPDFAILCYPVIAFGQPFSHVGSQRNLLGEDADAERLAELSTHNRVTAETPPTFLWHTYEDTVVPPQNSIVYYQALVEHGVSSEFHAFETGRHGVGLAAGIPGTELWPELCQAWLRKHEILAPQ